MKPMRRLVSAVVSTLVTGALLTSCGTGHLPDPAQPHYVPRGGVDGRTDSIIVDDVWIDAPHGVPAGANTSLRLDLSNESGRNDALVGVSTPIAERVTLHRNGESVDRIAVRPHSSTNLEWVDDVRLDHLRHAIQPGRWFPVTLRFAWSAPLRIRVTAGPVGTVHTTSLRNNERNSS